SSRLQQLGVKSNDLMLMQPKNLEEAFEMIEATTLSIRVDAKFDGPFVMVLDSVASLQSAVEEEAGYDARHMGIGARVISQGLRKLMWEIARHKVILIFVNQLRKTLNQYDPNGEYACLTGDTLIDCPRDLSKYPDGIPIKNLVGKQFYTYAW